MDHSPAGAGAAIMIRVWFESGDHDTGFRARITRTADVRERGDATVVTSPEQAVEEVRAWLADCQRRHLPDASG